MYERISSIACASRNGEIIIVLNAADTRCITVKGICIMNVSRNDCPKSAALIIGPVMRSNASTPKIPFERKSRSEDFWRAARKWKWNASAIRAYVALVTYVHVPIPLVKKSNENIVANAKSGPFHHFSFFAAGITKPIIGSEFGKIRSSRYAFAARAPTKYLNLTKPNLVRA